MTQVTDHTIMIIWVIKTFMYNSSVYFCHLFLISSASVRSLLFLLLSFIMPILAWNVPLISSIFLSRSLVFPILFSSVQLLSRVWLLVAQWTAAHQASLSIINSWSLLKLMSIESVMPSNHLILCRPLLLLPSVFLSIRVCFNELALHIRGQSFGASALASAVPMNIQDWFFF